MSQKAACAIAKGRTPLLRLCPGAPQRRHQGAESRVTERQFRPAQGTAICLGCTAELPDNEFRGFGPRITRFCDDCLENGLTDYQRHLSKLASQKDWRRRAA